MTLDRLVTQKIATLTVQPIAVNIIPLIPAGFTHPGFKPSQLSLRVKNRLYTLKDIYEHYAKGEKPTVYKVFEPPKGELEALKSAEKEGVAAAAAAPSEAVEATKGLAKDADAADAADAEDPVKKGSGRRTYRGGGMLNKLKNLKGFVLGREKTLYQEIGKDKLSNFVSLPAQGYLGTAIPHIVYLGMVYLTALRKPGMKNPVPPNVKKCAYFGFYHNPENKKPIPGVLIRYIDCSGRKVRGRFSLNATRKNDMNKRLKKLKRKVVSSFYLGGSKTRRAEK
jgi:hypothetical protein